MTKSATVVAQMEMMKCREGDARSVVQASSLNIAQVKRKCGLELAENFNLPESELGSHSVRRKKRMRL